MNLRVAIVTDENAFFQLALNFRVRPIGQRTEIEFELFFGRLKVMESEGRCVAPISANGASSAKFLYKANFPLQPSFLLGRIALMRFILADDAAK